jgi:uncharacterized protein YijF (DUF1287 family)
MTPFTARAGEVKKPRQSSMTSSRKRASARSSARAPEAHESQAGNHAQKKPENKPAASKKPRRAPAKAALAASSKVAAYWPPRKAGPREPWFLTPLSRDVMMLALPFMITAVTMCAMHATRDVQLGGALVARSTDLNTRAGAPRALTGLPKQMTPSSEVPAVVALQVPAETVPPSIAQTAPKTDPAAGVAPSPEVLEPSVPAKPVQEAGLPAALPSANPAAPAQKEIPSATSATALVTPPTPEVGPSKSKPVNIALAKPDVTAPAPPGSATELSPVPTNAAIPVTTPHEYPGQSITTATRCLPAPVRPQLKVLASRREAPAEDPEAFGLELARAARTQIHEFVIYNDRYTVMKYPMGDVRPIYGVCTDVIIRAYREVGIDLQELVHITRSGSGDTNIAHRRVDTLRRFFTQFGESLPVTNFAEDYRPGDIVSYYRPQNRHSRTHIAVVSDVYAPSGRPMIIHNRGWGPQQEDALFVDEITGHYRFTGMRLNAVAKAAPVPPKTKKVPISQPGRAPLKKVIKASLKVPEAANTSPVSRPKPR